MTKILGPKQPIHGTEAVECWRRTLLVDVPSIEIGGVILGWYGVPTGCVRGAHEALYGVRFRILSSAWILEPEMDGHQYS